MKEVVCTLITKNYGHYALVLHDSLIKQQESIHFCVFVSNGKLPHSVEVQLLSRKHVTIYYEASFKNELSILLKEKYFTSYHDAYRWGMKSQLLIKLLNHGYERAIYVDSDIYFYNDYRFLFEELKKFSILLSPHWRSSYPNLDMENFKLNFLDGIYNGGFIGASQGGQAALTYWTELCLFNCEVNRSEGFYVDQRYLDIFPTRFEDVGHITHKGCNVANWNLIDCKRVLQPDGNVLINNTEPIVFLHITNSMLKGVYLWKNDVLLQPYIEQYRDNLLKYDDVDIIVHFFEKGMHIPSRSEQHVVNPVKNSFIKQLAWFVYRTIKKLKRKLY
ncbi:hypothetical protein [Mariniflexile sp.]|uniref:hypothetical protein n=1 Tax=Mariniflexile sp. TaxID=1979402 RepID=UPI00356424BD